MNQLYPLKFKPLFKDKIWGGQKIKEVMQMDFGDLPNCGEAWILSGVQGNQTVINNGFLSQNELNELVEVYMGDLVGEENYEKYGNEFPLLIKIIDANDWLSIQVHPDDALAKKRKIGNGKTEMWYILNAEEGAELISGFNREVSPESYQKHLKEKTLKSIMNFEKVEEGDVFFMPAGRVHALGPGLLLAEIQQTSDTTYRIYDWDRLDAEGNSRDLHIDEAMEAIDFKVYDEYKTNYTHRRNTSSVVVKSPFFNTNILELDKPIMKDYSGLDSFVIYICTNGAAAVDFVDGKEVLEKGEALLIPAITENISIYPDRECKILEVYI